MSKLRGTFQIMSIADLIQWTRTAQKSGDLVVRDSDGKQIDVVFLDGRIICSSTNSPRERYGEYLVALGLCRTEDVEWAQQRVDETGVMTGALLVQSGRLPETLAVATLTQKTIEDLCDIFLWQDGYFEFYVSPIQLRQFLPIDLDPIRIVNEGLRRQESWHRLCGPIHSEKVLTATGQSLEPKAGWDDAVIARLVLGTVDGNKAVQDVIEALPFSRYKVTLALHQLHAAGLIVEEDQTEFGQREARIQASLEAAFAARADGRWGHAVQILEGLVEAFPRRSDLADELVETLDGFRGAIYRHNFELDDMPVLSIGPEAGSRIELDPKAGFLLSRIDGKTSVQDLIRLVPFDETQCIRVLKRLLDARVIDFPNRRGTVIRRP